MLSAATELRFRTQDSEQKVANSSALREPPLGLAPPAQVAASPSPDVVQGSIIDDYEPTFEAIADGGYPISRPLYFYAKAAHVGAIPGMRAFLDEFTSNTFVMVIMDNKTTNISSSTAEVVKVNLGIAVEKFDSLTQTM